MKFEIIRYHRGIAQLEVDLILGYGEFVHFALMLDSTSHILWRYKRIGASWWTSSHLKTPDHSLGD